MKTARLLIIGLACSITMVEAADTVFCPGIVTCDQSRDAVWAKGFKETCDSVVSVTKVSNTRLEIECAVNDIKGWQYELIVKQDGYDINLLSKPENQAQKP